MARIRDWSGVCLTPDDGRRGFYSKSRARATSKMFDATRRLSSLRIKNFSARRMLASKVHESSHLEHSSSETSPPKRRGQPMQPAPVAVEESLERSLQEARSRWTSRCFDYVMLLRKELAVNAHCHRAPHTRRCRSGITDPTLQRGWPRLQARSPCCVHVQARPPPTV